MSGLVSVAALTLLVLVSSIHVPSVDGGPAGSREASALPDAGPGASPGAASAAPAVSCEAPTREGACEQPDLPSEGEAEGGADEEAGPGVAPRAVPSRLRSPPIGSVKSLPAEADLLARARKGADGRLVVRRGGRDERLTIDAGLQGKLETILKNYQTPYAAVVALEPQTGRVVAMAEHSEAVAGLRGLCTKALYPAASIFKIVTATALLEAGVKKEQSECFHGGKRRLTEKLMQDTSRDSRCYSLSTALAKSANVVFGKLTQKHLDAKRLMSIARRFRFNQQIDFPVPTDVSLAAIPEDTFGLSTTGAGFGDVFLSPLHGAAIAAVSANGGVWRRPVLFESDARGEAGAADRVMSPQTAAQLNEMMEETVTEGTARHVFRERGYRVEGAVGKTGSLADRNPFRDYSWFVGFAPKDRPRVAVAAVVVNDRRWRIRATWLAREAMRLYLAGAPSVGAASTERR